jgi:hypothetical protein
MAVNIVIKVGLGLSTRKVLIGLHKTFSEN